MRNISGEGLNNLPCHITGIPDHSLENVHLENISFTVPGGSAAVNSNYVVPENIADRPEFDLFGGTLPAYGIYFRHVNGLTLDSVCFTPLQSDERAMLWIDDVQNMTFNDVCQSPVFGAIEDNSLQNVLHLIYDSQNSLLEIKNPERGQLSIYGIDGKLIYLKNTDTENSLFNTSILPFAWKFESEEGKLSSGKVWRKQ